MENLVLNMMKPDTTATTDLLIKSSEERLTNTGKPYVYIMVSDCAKQEHPLSYWNHTKEMLMQRGIYDGMVVTAEIHAKIFNDVLSFDARTISLPDHDTNKGDFVRMPKKDVNEMYDACMNMLSNDTIYGKIVHKIFTIFHKKILSHGAAKKMHHNYLGGFIEHTYGVAKMADAIASVYSDVDRNMLVAGALLHDIGKLYEMDTNEIGISEYTLSGLQLGHAVLGIKLISKITESMGLYQTKERELLEAMLASHHGNLDWGAIAKPNFKEAYFLHIADLIDSRNNMFDSEYEKLEPGELASTRCFGLDNVNVWRP